ncbi:ATP-dependent DNA helicase [Panus rudis PR-1116 ss-1]|nr:ATP-dependent DNA helicase [Panus rudis PR-1116 ss-1]
MGSNTVRPSRASQSQTSTIVDLTAASSSASVDRRPVLTQTTITNALDDDEQQLWDSVDPIPDVVIVDDEPPSVRPAATVAKSTPHQATSTGLADFTDSPYYREALTILRERFRYNSFRPNQMEAIHHTLNGRDVLVLVPTGGGKSLCFQVPALCRGGKTKGLTVVIGPLKALIKDQTNALISKGIDVVAFISGQEDDQLASAKAFAALRKTHDRPRLLYITPEKVQHSDQVRMLLQRLYNSNELARFVVDEAHCISKWGKDFRDAYDQLSSLRQSFPNVPIMALTATATTSVEKDIVNILGMRDVVRITASYNRPNLRYTVLSGIKNTIGHIGKYIQENHPRDTGIIYCNSRVGCEKVAQALRNQFSFSVRHFHAKMDERDKASTQAAWQEGTCKIIVATIAFGMGIDKPDVRYVIHYDPPMSLDGYFQETGRAGRDGKPSDCIMYYSYQPQVFRRINEDEKTTREQKEHQTQEYQRVIHFATNDVDCRRVQLLTYFHEEFDPKDCRQTCDNCQAGHISVQDFGDEARKLVQLAQDMAARGALSSQTLFKQVFRGMKGKDAIKYQHLAQYGAGQSLKMTEVERILDALISKQVLELVCHRSSSGYSHNKLQVYADVFETMHRGLICSHCRLDPRPTTSCGSPRRSRSESKIPSKVPAGRLPNSRPQNLHMRRLETIPVQSLQSQSLMTRTLTTILWTTRLTQTFLPFAQTPRFLA